MIAAFALPEEMEPGILRNPRDVEAVHLTLLRPDGTGKAKMMPENKSTKIIVGRSNLPIVIGSANDLLGLAITEGIEDALTAYQTTGLGSWAAGSAARLPGLAAAVPNFVETLTIFVDPDKAGRDNAQALAAALRGRRIEIVMEGT
ncbi:hypothetical protein XH79_18800 [Bradyrhizobium sp. CCBAU 45389]|nr:hypothetical protein [Bradyrhizobium sp. CCBAU 45389]